MSEISRAELEQMIDSKLKYLNDNFELKIRHLSEKVDSFLKAITDMGIINNRHEHVIAKMEATFAVQSDKICGLQSALDTLRSNIPDEKTITKLEEKSKLGWQKMVWLITIATAILAVLVFVGELYIDNRQMKKQMSELIMDEPKK